MSLEPKRLARDGEPGLFEPLHAAALDAACRACDESGRDVRMAGCLPPLMASYRPEEAQKDLDPDAYAERALGWVEQGASIVGGCCEVGPAHIKALSERLTAAGYRPAR